MNRRTAILAGAGALLPFARPDRTGAQAWHETQIELEKRLTLIEADAGGRLGVAACDLRNRRFGHRANERFPMCSTFKLLAVAAVLAKVDAGSDELARWVPYGPDDLLEYAPVTRAQVGAGGMPLEALCAAAIEWSDNTAANLLLAGIGGPAGVTRYARSLGDEMTRLDRTEPTLNEAIPGDPRDTTTPAAMVDDLRALVWRHALSSRSKARLERWMIDCKTGASRLRARMPSSTWIVGDKTGTGANGTANDVGFLRSPTGQRSFVAVYFTGSPAAAAARDATIARVGRTVAFAFGDD